MKLFANESVDIKFSTEKFVDYYNSSNVIAEEALSDYLYKIKDSFATLFKKLSGSVNDKAVLDITSTKFETLHKIKRLKFVNVKDYMVSKPENFKGKYIDYTLDLVNVSGVIVGDVEATLNNLKLAIASFINEFSESKVSSLYGAVYFKKTEKLIEQNKREISKYFPIANGSTKAYVGDLLKTLNDIEALYKNIEVLDSTLNTTKISYISKLTNECADLVDSLIEQNTRSNVLAKNDTAKKELINAIHISAREVELLNYLYSNAIIFYSSFKNLTDELNKIPYSE